MIVGIDAKRIVRNGTGLGSYGRTLVNDLIRLGDSDMQLRLYAPDEGRDDLRGQIIEGAEFCYPKGHPAALRKAWWRSRSIVGDLVRDGVTVYHGLSGELPMGLRKAGIRGIVTIHDLNQRAYAAGPSGAGRRGVCRPHQRHLSEFCATLFRRCQGRAQGGCP